MTDLGTIRITAALLDRHDGHTLLVRKRDTTAFMQAGGNEADRIVDADMFRLELLGPVTAAAEIEELAWVDPCSPGGLVLAPLTRDHAPPLCSIGAAIRPCNDCRTSDRDIMRSDPAVIVVSERRPHERKCR